jgi:hypothetical protein
MNLPRFSSGIKLPDAPVPPEERAARNGAIETMELADRAAGITDPGTVAARAAWWRGPSGGGRQ